MWNRSSKMESHSDGPRIQDKGDAIGVSTRSNLRDFQAGPSMDMARLTMGITGALAVPDISETESDRG